MITTICRLPIDRLIKTPYVRNNLDLLLVWLQNVDQGRIQKFLVEGDGTGSRGRRGKLKTFVYMTVGLTAISHINI